LRQTDTDCFALYFITYASHRRIFGTLFIVYSNNSKPPYNIS